MDMLWIEPDKEGRHKVCAAKCGMTFDSIAFIHNLESINPLIEIPQPLGMGAVDKIIHLIKEYKLNGGYVGGH